MKENRVVIDWKEIGRRGVRRKQGGEGFEGNRKRKKLEGWRRVVRKQE